MIYKPEIHEILNVSENGVLATGDVTAAGIHRGVLRELVEEGSFYRYSRGIYVRADTWEDELYLLQCKYQRGIFSHDTALYLLGYSDRAPARFTMTFPKGYNSPSLKNELVNIKRVVPNNYSLGVTEILSPCGNPIRVYDLERSLCDILRGSGCDIQIVVPAMKKYAASKEKNLQKLSTYAEQLHVMPKVRRYMEVLL